MTQIEAVMQYIEDNGSITSKDAFELGITRLSAVVFKLKEKYPEFGLKTKIETVNTRYGTSNIARYYRD